MRFAPRKPAPARSYETLTLMVDGKNILDGARLYRDVIDEALERKLVARVDDMLARSEAGALGGRPFQGIKGRSINRSPGATRTDVQSGGKYDDYKKQRIIAAGDDVSGRPFEPEPMPAEARELHDALVARGVVPAEPGPEIFLANNYEAGQYTLNHIDAAYIERPLVVTTLLSSGDMVFGKYLKRVAPGAAQFGGKPGFESLTVSLPPRSTLVLRGVSADECQHAINAVAERRISILLRRAKPGGAPAAAAPPRRPRRA